MDPSLAPVRPPGEEHSNPVGEQRDIRYQNPVRFTRSRSRGARRSRRRGALEEGDVGPTGGRNHTRSDDSGLLRRCRARHREAGRNGEQTEHRDEEGGDPSPKGKLSQCHQPVNVALRSTG